MAVAALDDANDIDCRLVAGLLVANLRPISIKIFFFGLEPFIFIDQTNLIINYFSYRKLRKGKDNR